MQHRTGRLVTLEGDLDVSRRAEVERILLSNIDGGTLRVDLSGVTFMDSTVISALIKALKAYRARGGELILIAPSPGVVKLLQITGLNRIFRTEEREFSKVR